MMKKQIGFIFMWIIVIGAIIAGAVWLVLAGNKPGELNEFAACIEESGTKFYGAFWCPHCQNQKALFGKSAEFLPYVECATPDGQGTTAVCNEAGIESYPTWIFPDGSRADGEQSLEDLAEKTGCELPAADSQTATS